MEKEIEQHAVILKYDDNNADRHEIDAYILSEALKGFSDFCKVILQADHDGAVSKSSVVAIRPGCVEIDFLLRSAFAVGEIGISALPFAKTFSDIVSLYKKMNGKPPRRVSVVGDGNVLVEANKGNITINQNTYNFVTQNPSIGESAEKFIRKPLSAGVENIQVKANNVDIASISKADGDGFKMIDFNNALLENKANCWLKVVRPVLHGGSKWAFNNGGSLINAEIEDKDFLNEVKSGVMKFGNGDHLNVTMRCVQKKNGRKLSTDNFIEKVHEKKNFDNEQLFLHASI